MGTGRVNRLWAVGGALVSAALLAIAWFLLIAPRNSELGALQEQTQLAQDQLVPLQHRLGELRQENTKLADRKAELAIDHGALPATSQEADFVRMLQAADATTGVSVKSVAVDPAVKVTAAGKQLSALPITVTALGTPENLNRFLDHIQQVQPRAALVRSTDLQKDVSSGGYTLVTDLDVFVAATS
jgi:Tfp pilus assembly protein PilO